VVRDLREYTKKTQTRLVAGFLLLVFLVGDGLIFLFYGKEAGLLGLVCILAALLPVLIVVFFLWIADRVVKRNQS
jgi:hypothetical protein